MGRHGLKSKNHKGFIEFLCLCLHLTCQLLSKTLDEVDDEEWICGLGYEMGIQICLYNGHPNEKVVQEVFQIGQFVDLPCLEFLVQVHWCCIKEVNRSPVHARSSQFVVFISGPFQPDRERGNVMC